MLTLDHWGPAAGAPRTGGWGSRSTSVAFVAFADVLSTTLADRVEFWITQNEPSVIAVDDT